MYTIRQSDALYDINKDVGVVYKFDIDLRVTDILKLCDKLTIQQILGMYKYEPDSDTGKNTRFTFNKYENNKFNLDYEATHTLKEKYLKGDNNLYPYKLELYNVDDSNYNLLPDYMKDLLPVDYCKKAPPFIIPDINVKTVRTLPEIVKTKVYGYYTLVNKVNYIDHWVWVNLPYDMYKNIKMPAKRVHWMPQVNDFDCYTINRSALIDLFEDIAENGLKVEVRIEVNNFGQLANCVESGHRIVAAKYLQLPTIPCALIYRQNDGYPFITPEVKDEPQNKEVLDLLNNLYNPELIFNSVPYDEIHKACYKRCELLDTDIEEIRNIIVNNFPNKIYTSLNQIRKDVCF